MILSVETKFSKVGLQNFYWEFVSPTLTSLVAEDRGAGGWDFQEVFIALLGEAR